MMPAEGYIGLTVQRDAQHYVHLANAASLGAGQWHKPFIGVTDVDEQIKW